MNVTETYKIKNAEMKYEILGINNVFIKSLDGLKSDMYSKFSRINTQLIMIKQNLNVNMEDLVPESLSKMKDPIIKALRENNVKIHQRGENQENRISVLESDLNEQYQYNSCNNLDIQGIPGSVSDYKL